MNCRFFDNFLPKIVSILKLVYSIRKDQQKQKNFSINLKRKFFVFKNHKTYLSAITANQPNFFPQNHILFWSWVQNKQNDIYKNYYFLNTYHTYLHSYCQFEFEKITHFEPWFVILRDYLISLRISYFVLKSILR